LVIFAVFYTVVMIDGFDCGRGLLDGRKLNEGVLEICGAGALTTDIFDEFPVWRWEHAGDVFRRITNPELRGWTTPSLFAFVRFTVGVVISWRGGRGFDGRWGNDVFVGCRGSDFFGRRDGGEGNLSCVLLNGIRGGGFNSTFCSTIIEIESCVSDVRRYTLGALLTCNLSIFDFQDQTTKVGVRQIEVPQVFESDFVGDTAFTRLRHLDDLKDIVDEFLLRKLDDGKDFRFNCIPHIWERCTRRSKTIAKVVQVGIDGKIIVGCTVSEMKTRGNCKVRLY
jgi:hypothetical protein